MPAQPFNKVDCVWCIAVFWPSTILSIRKSQWSMEETTIQAWKQELDLKEDKPQQPAENMVYTILS